MRIRIVVIVAILSLTLIACDDSDGFIVEANNRFSSCEGSKDFDACAFTSIAVECNIEIGRFNLPDFHADFPTQSEECQDFAFDMIDKWGEGNHENECIELLYGINKYCDFNTK